MGKFNRLAGIVALAGASAVAAAHAETDAQAVARLDLEYQAAVKRNDAETMDRILHPEFILVRGNGQTVSREAIIEAARKKTIDYEVQDEEPGTQSVRVYGDAAVVTALLNIKGRMEGGELERRVWFSDTYVRTPQGWKYAFAQVSLPLP
ncbi:MAG TPA: nuclear transport factor 2 family protein [Sphingomicrobium sp.]